MSKNLYLAGLNVLGTPHAIFQRTRFGTDETQRAILIQVRNAAQLARSQGTLASLAQAVAPATIENKVNAQISSEISSALKAKGVDASVTIVDPVGFKPANGAHIAADIAIGLTTFGGIALIWRLLIGKRIG